MKKSKENGISLIVLIITVIVIIIIATAIILTFTNNGVLDQSKKARFMSDFVSVEEGVSIYSLSKFNATTGNFELPLKGYLTAEDKTYITQNVPTLNTKIEELSGSIDTVNLAWINSGDINVNLSSEKREKGYIIDVVNGQIYDYIGDVFEGKRWHTLDGGVVIGNTNVPATNLDLWGGWIKLTLYYPVGSTERKWRLGTEGELRVDPMSMWQNYTGPITVPLDRVQDVWIKYILDNKEITIPPVGTLLVDIVPDKTGYTKVPAVNVKINYDEGATIKEYRIGDSGWITYNGEFTVTENCIIEARASKTETIYNTDGSILTTRDVAGRDLVYIGNIGIEETDLVAPTITRLPGVGSEKARVQVVYPANADKKIYKINYGIEQNYTTEISVNSYGTYIIAYYYDSAGKRSKAAAIRINDTTAGATAESPTIYDPQPPYVPGNPEPPYNPGTYGVNIPAPTISVNPTTLAEEVQVSINSPANADKVYIKLGRYASYVEYTMPVMVRKNMEVYAYYKTYAGERSDTGYGVVSNIKQTNKPYVYIDANPYPWSGSYGASNVTVTINYSDATTIEYSEDGIVYTPYTAPFNVTENKTIYARGTNIYGVTETSLNITNIGKLASPTPIGNLSVGINVNPEPSLSTDRVAKVNVTIDYDSKATEKYYSIGKYGTLQTYTGAFDVTSNCSIYAYAKGVNAEGMTSKTIDNITTGIAEPMITAIPGNGEQASKVAVSITFDKYATIKRYSLDGGDLRDYTGSFEVSKNGTVIYAYSQNELGQSSESSYTVENIMPEPPILVLDKGKYYILKLNYPVSSKNREYKWKVNGEWKGYKEAGILLLKPEYRDQLIVNGTLIQIEDENGKLVTFTGDYYFMDVPICELFENLFMRWDVEPLSAPQIIITPTAPAIQVTADIMYNSALITKQYKIIKPGETSGTWMDYTGPITIDKNGSVIYAKGMDITEVWTAESMLKVTNIDENPPVIKLTADFVAAQQKVAVRVSVTDDVEVGKIKWAAGTQGESYFTNFGTEIQNDSIVNITSNGYYTFYAEDKVGNKQVYTLNITNVDLTPPLIDITVSPEVAVGLTADVTINYGDSTVKQYKIGTNNTVWSTYTTTFAISSYTILANNWQDADGTVTIYAKGKDSAGNEIITQKKVVSLDLDMPNVPVIQSNSGYPILSSYGITFDATTKIIYDTRTDIDNYYSIDNGLTWNIYTGEFNLSSGSIIAKSVKRNTGLEVTVSKTVTVPSNAIGPNAYDGDQSTAIVKVADKYMKIDSSMQGKNLAVVWYASSFVTNNLTFLDESMQQISVITKNGAISTDIYTIPVNTKWIRYDGYTGGQSYSTSLFEIYPSNEPTFTTQNGYMLLHADPTKSIRSPYQMITISYFPTSVQRLYRIGATGNWLNYNDQSIKVNQGETIYSKGIDQYGKETRLISSYTANVVDALESLAFDKDETTYYKKVANKFIQVDPSMQGKNLAVVWYASSYVTNNLTFLNESMQQISSVTKNGATSTDIYTIPVNTKWIRYDGYAGGQSYSTYIYEIYASNEPTFTITNVYMLLHADPAQVIRSPHQMVTISYFPTSVQKLYRIGTTGDWINYQDKAVLLNLGETIYSKGIDEYGNETRIISSHTADIADALGPLAFDQNETTYYNKIANKLIQVDPSMQGKNVTVRWSSSTSVTNKFTFLNESMQQISFVTKSGAVSNNTYIIPANTKWIRYDGYAGTSSYSTQIYEIYPY
jgi:hypothetical protein